MIRKLFNLISVGILVVVLPYLIFYILQSDYSWNTFLHPGSWHWFNRLFGFQLPLIFVFSSCPFSHARYSPPVLPPKFWFSSGDAFHKIGFVEPTSIPSVKVMILHEVVFTGSFGSNNRSVLSAL